jgi:hypothetical protein
MLSGHPALSMRLTEALGQGHHAAVKLPDTRRFNPHAHQLDRRAIKQGGAVSEFVPGHVWGTFSGPAMTSSCPPGHSTLLGAVPRRALQLAPDGHVVAEGEGLEPP